MVKNQSQYEKAKSAYRSPFVRSHQESFFYYPDIGLYGVVSCVWLCAIIYWIAIDEIMYFFESTGYRTVFFEDLDRLSDPKIFVHLRELNNLLNNDDAIKEKPIVFVYAVRDDIFSKEDRTKFFDFIIPVIPVINSTNSGEILLQRLQEAKENGINHDISQGFVLDVAPYISDMRILQNIYNEFVVYKKTLRTSQDLSLSDEQMLAMIVFKNLYPSDFADIQDEKGEYSGRF